MITAGRDTRPAPLLPFGQKCLCFSTSGPDLAPFPKKEEIPMALNISWLNDLAKAKDHARQTKKPILLDFFNPQ